MSDKQDLLLTISKDEHDLRKVPFMKRLKEFISEQLGIAPMLRAKSVA